MDTLIHIPEYYQRDGVSALTYCGQVVPRSRVVKWGHAGEHTCNMCEMILAIKHDLGCYTLEEMLKGETSVR